MGHGCLPGQPVHGRACGTTAGESTSGSAPTRTRRGRSRWRTSGWSCRRAVSGKRASIELMGFDACLMANAEVAAALVRSSRSMVASQDTEPGRAGTTRRSSGSWTTTRPRAAEGRRRRIVTGIRGEAARGEERGPDAVGRRPGQATGSCPRRSSPGASSGTRGPGRMERDREGAGPHPRLGDDAAQERAPSTSPT